MSESDLSRKCIQWVENNGGKVIKIHGDEFTEVGTPDHLGAIVLLNPGECIHFFIELKLPGEEPTKIQQYRLKEWQAFGFRTGCAHSLEEYITIILGE